MSSGQLRATAKPFLPPLMIPAAEYSPLVEGFILVGSLVRQEGDASCRQVNNINL